MNRRQRVLGKGSSSDGLGRVGLRDYKEKGYHMVNERHAAMVGNVKVSRTNGMSTHLRVDEMPHTANAWT